MRDTQRFYYTQIGVPRAQVLEHLQQEASMRGVPFATHLIDLLIDRDLALYGQESSHLWFPRGMNIVPLEKITTGTELSVNVDENLDAFCGFLEAE